MPNKTPQKIFIERYNSLPAELKKSLFSAITSELIERVAEFYHLNEEKSAILVSLVGDVLSGFLHYNDFSKKLQENLGVNPLIANSIGKEIDRDIFLPVRKFLREVYRPISEEELKGETKAEIKEVVIPPAEIEVSEIEVKPAEIKPVTPPATPKIVEEKPVIEKRKIFLPFFRFKKPAPIGDEAEKGAPRAPVIIGEEETAKPTLEAPTPFVISFEEVKPQKEKIVSTFETAGAEKEVKTAPPIKIVNYVTLKTEPIQTPIKPKEEKPVIAPETKKEEPEGFKIASPISAVEIKKEEKILEKEPEKPSLVEEAEPKEVLKPEEKKPEAPKVPPENIVDLRKFKF